MVINSATSSGTIFGLGAVTAIAIVYKKKSPWVLKQWGEFSDGEDPLANILAKLVVVAFVAFMLCLWEWLEGAVDMIISFVRLCHQKGWGWWIIMRNADMVLNTAFVQIALNLIMPSVSALLGIAIWEEVWTSYVCESPKDMGCSRETFVGSTLYGYRREICTDRALSCEMSIAYSPLFALSLFTLLGTMAQIGVNAVLERKIYP